MRRHPERHYTARIGWLRAGVLGANDGIVSTASLILGVASAGAGGSEIVVAGIAGLVAGAMSMAAGEYVSVSSQADSEAADIRRERRELDENVELEREELANIYVKRGLEPALAGEVAQQLMAHDALGAHTRDELGLSEEQSARPTQAALVSAVTFAAGASLPLILGILSPSWMLRPLVAGGSLVCLAFMGALAARTGGASVWSGAGRVTFWGALAMAATALVGALFGTTV